MNNHTYIYVISLGCEGNPMKIGVSINPYGRCGHMRHLYGEACRLEATIRCDENGLDIESSAHGILSQYHHDEFNGNYKNPGYFGREVFLCDVNTAIDAVFRAFKGERVAKSYIQRHSAKMSELRVSVGKLKAGDLFYSNSVNIRGAFEYIGPHKAMHIVKSLGSSWNKKLASGTMVIRIQEDKQ